MLAPAISVVIPTRNRRSSVTRALASLARQSSEGHDFEVVVVANDCSDDTTQHVRSLTLPFATRVLEIPVPGMSKARNAGAAIAQASLLMFMDDDIEVGPGH